MKKQKILIYLAPPPNEDTLGVHLDIAVKERKKGNEVILLCCDHSLGLCMRNPRGNRFLCRFCEQCQQEAIQRYLPNVQHIWMRDCLKKFGISSYPELTYRNCDELMNLTWKGVEIGYGVMSTYISLTRNLYPAINDESKHYFNALIREEFDTLAVIENMQHDFNFDLIVFQNGRGAQFKPLINFCQREKIDFWCTETIPNGDISFTNHFWNSYPHDAGSLKKKYQNFWNQSHESEEEKTRIGRSFYEKRRNSKPAGDVVYTKSQHKGLMPTTWRTDKENIVIFNSSEDEFAAISKMFEEDKVFVSQLEGVKAIVSHYVNDFSKHFTLRVHPHLRDIPYHYHTDIYKLDYPNLTVIPADSPISTYALMDAADKVVVFGSTAGIEASFWGKPVINLAPTFYNCLDVVYIPRLPEDVWGLIDTPSLPPRQSIFALMYGYFTMSDKHQTTEFLSLKYNALEIGHKKIIYYDWQTIFGSHLLFCLSKVIVGFIAKWNFLSKFKSLPQKEME